LTATEKFEGWAILELMGHRRLAGHVSEVEIAGHGMLRLDVPSLPYEEIDSSVWPREDIVATQFYSPASLYCLTPTTEDVARKLAASLRPTPAQRWELEAPKPAPEQFEYDQDDADEALETLGAAGDDLPF